MASDDLLHRGATESFRFPMSGRCVFVHFLRESSQRKTTALPEKALVRIRSLKGRAGRSESGALLALMVFLKYGEDELSGEGVQAIGDENAEAYIRQKMGVHVNPVIAEYDDPDDCERKEQIV